MALSARVNATHVGARTNEGNEGVAVGKEAIFQRAKVEKWGIVGYMAVAISVDDSVDAERVGGNFVEVTEDEKGESDVT